MFSSIGRLFKSAILLSSCCLFVGCFSSGRGLKLSPKSANPQTADFSWHCKESFPNGEPVKVISPDELDVRSCDISSWDLTQYTAQELADVISFDRKTKFPPRSKLPKNFSAKKILKNGKNPGLYVSTLHKQGITGKGVSLAVIDQNLLLNHKEYASSIVFYEQAPFWTRAGVASMHAPAVVSIASGKKVGVAPDARVFALAPAFGQGSAKQYDARPNAAALRRVAEINTQLPPEQKIRVVSISRGFSENDLGAKEFEEAKQVLENDGVAVFTTNDVFTLSRNHSLDSADDAKNYCRTAYWFGAEDMGFLSADMQNVIVPTDFRVLASPTGNNDYVHYANGGLSWAVPYVAGLYALGVQVYPQLTKEIFVKAVHDTATRRNCEYKGKKFSQSLVNPTALINYLKELNK